MDFAIRELLGGIQKTERAQTGAVIIPPPFCASFSIVATEVVTKVILERLAGLYIYISIYIPMHTRPITATTIDGTIINTRKGIIDMAQMWRPEPCVILKFQCRSAHSATREWLRLSVWGDEMLQQKTRLV